MKIGNMEGTPEEIKNFIVINDCNLQDILNLPEPPLNLLWFVPPVILTIISLSCLTLFRPNSETLKPFLFLIGCGAGIWLSVNVQLRFKNSLATVLVALGTVLIMLVAAGYITPIEIFRSLKELK
jgi:hypothetical protein